MCREGTWLWLISLTLKDMNLSLRVVGKPIAHSLSPLIHNTAFRQEKLNWMYHAVEVSRMKPVSA
ncbi:MAG: hypothetical protein Ct9H90mP30_4500 [Actinomycetota bacterium]|nr:MAG: hypothetical protein Ct9H90mP30_4500 [Actinomycetota bacterium]